MVFTVTRAAPGFRCPPTSKGNYASLCLVGCQTHNFMLLRKSSQCSLSALYSHCCIPLIVCCFYFLLAFTSALVIAHIPFVQITVNFFSWKAFVFPVTGIYLSQH